MMPMKPSRIILPLLCLVLAGCSSAPVQPTPFGNFPGPQIGAADPVAAAARPPSP